MQTEKILIVACGLTLSALSASAQMFTGTAINNGTIEPGGASGSPWFHNAQAVTGSGFEEYAISTFNFTAGNFGLGSVSGISSAEISYTQSNAFFTTGGAVEFYVTFDSSVDNSDYAGLAHTSSGVGINDSEFSDSPSSQLVGSSFFNDISNGTVDNYTLDFSGVESLLVDAINSGSDFSIILTAPSGSGTAATYAGIQNNTYPNQIDLSITVVPEPSTYAALLGLIGLGFVLYRRRK